MAHPPTDGSTPEGREPATLQEIWNILREVSESQKETDRRMQETDRRMQETDRRMQETDRQMQETDRRMQETDRVLKRQGRETDRRLRKLDDLFNGQWGKLMEALVEGDLVKLLRQRDIDVHHTFSNHKAEYGGRRWEIDLVALNASEAVVVEVKTTLKVRNVDHFLETLRNYHLIMPEFAGSKSVYGAVAYLKADEASDQYAERQGLYVIRATGSSASITNADTFRPRAFGSAARPAPGS